MSLMSYTWIDLTHTLTPAIPTWDCSCGFEHKTLVTYEECPEPCKFLIQRIEMRAGAGTHMDAPLHCYPGTQSIADIPLNKLLCSCVVINVAEKADAHYLVTLEDVLDFEKKHGNHWNKALVIFYTGWDRLWNTPEMYHNHYRFPSISKQAAEYLLNQNINGIGIDTLSPDVPESGFPVHQLLLGAGKYIIENVANASKMPPIGGYALVMPIKTAGGTEAPIRLLGITK